MSHVMNRAKNRPDWFNRLESEIDNKIIAANNNSIATRTREGYKYIEGLVYEFCKERGFCPLPLDERSTLTFLAAASTALKHGSLKVYRSGIRHYHIKNGYPDPTAIPSVLNFMSGNARLTRCSINKKNGFNWEEITEFSGKMFCEETSISIRDRSMMLMGFSIAGRASEVVNLRRGLITMHSDGMIVRIPWSKTDQEGHGADVAVPKRESEVTCALRALEAWLTEYALLLGRPLELDDYIYPHLLCPEGQYDGRIIIKKPSMTTSQYRQVVKKVAASIGLDPKLYAGHSLRRAFATEADKAGASRVQIMAQGRWLSDAVDEYISASKKIRDSALNCIPL